MTFEVVEEEKVTVEKIKVIRVNLTETECAIIGGLVSMVNSDRSENREEILRLQVLFNQIFDEHYPGYYIIPEFDTDSDSIIIFQS